MILQMYWQVVEHLEETLEMEETTYCRRFKPQLKVAGVLEKVRERCLLQEVGKTQQTAYVRVESVGAAAKPCQHACREMPVVGTGKGCRRGRDLEGELLPNL